MFVSFVCKLLLITNESSLGFLTIDKPSVNRLCTRFSFLVESGVRRCASQTASASGLQCDYHPISQCILSLPEIADGFRRLIQPIMIRQQPHEFDGAGKLPRIRVRPA